MTSYFTTQEMLQLENKSKRIWYKHAFILITDYKQIWKDIKKKLGYFAPDFKK